MPYPPSLLTIAGRLIPKCIYVYSGLGASERCLKQLINCLETFTDRKVVELSADDLLHSNWQNNADLICFSGGYDKGFLSALGMRGCNLVREFVIGGGRYLGICAGAYFASHICEFDKGGENEVIGERQIVLFNGTARGPVYPGFEYKSERGSHAAFLITDDAPCQFPRLVSTYFNGGPAFFSDNWNKTTVLYK
ncbi:unnamed protein product [Protopolystoma xenopodis]|uniref:Biotin-protein ligase N-terminal domain-containing protein n=1 Tax=Protopolystoma xenopodis TaxID=117903 RepID=A0A3S5CJM1_9PLAT|nr:unnamed protein product [Protopolystoma xenopodis]